MVRAAIAIVHAHGVLPRLIMTGVAISISAIILRLAVIAINTIGAVIKLAQRPQLRKPINLITQFEMG